MINPRNDRTIHAEHPEYDIVRYDRAGKWKLYDRASGKERSITMTEAVRLATDPEARAHLDRPGGRQFDAKVLQAIRARKDTP